MATYQSDLYNIETGTASSTLPLNYTQANVNQDGGKSRIKTTLLNQAVTAYASGDVVQLFMLSKGSRPTSISFIADTATSSLTCQAGVTGTAGFFSGSAIATAGANTRVELLTQASAYAQETAQDYTIILTFGGVSVASGAKITVTLFYVRD